ncbi:MAG: hypothetical protein FVQ83_00170 [Chloroflexi bacterium]|nr:hypothetical protein [Chloroflexota bacterium]
MKTNLPLGTIKDEKGVKWVYTWLLLSPFITLPWMAINLFGLRGSSPLTSWVWAMITPAFVHILLISPLRSPHLFVHRHAQQALLLVSMRVLSAVVFLGLTRGEGQCVWFFVNGLLWLWGTIWGRGQLKRGDSWLMRFEGEGGELPRPWALDDQVRIESSFENISPVQQVNPKILSVKIPTSNAPSHVQSALREGFDLAKNLKKEEAIGKFLIVFRDGPLDWRKQAIDELKKLNQVENF